MNKFVWSILAIMVINISVFSQKEVKYYRYCENFNYPLHARFWAPIEKNQCAEINGRFFKVTYEYNSYSKAYRMKSIEHFYLNQPQAIYEYRISDYTGEEVKYSNAQKMEFTYDRSDRMTEIRVKDKSGNPCVNLYGTAKYVYVHQKSSDFIEKRYTLDDYGNEHLREYPNNNNLKLELKLKNIKFDSKKWRVWSKVHHKSFMSSIEYTYPNGSNGLECNTITKYYHRNTATRKIESDGCYELIKTYGKYGFLKTESREDLNENLIGNKELYRMYPKLKGNEVTGYYYEKEFRDENDDTTGFSDGMDVKSIEYNHLFHRVRVSRFNGLRDEYEPIERNNEGIIVKTQRFKGKEAYKSYIQRYNSKGLISELLIENNQQNGGKKKEISYTYDQEDKDRVVQSSEFNYNIKNELKNPIKCPRDASGSFPRLDIVFDQKGYQTDVIRHEYDKFKKYQILGEDLDLGLEDAYPYNYVPIIKYIRTKDGVLHKEIYLNADNSIFDPDEVTDVDGFYDELVWNQLNGMLYTYKSEGLKRTAIKKGFRCGVYTNPKDILSNESAYKDLYTTETIIDANGVVKRVSAKRSDSEQNLLQLSRWEAFINSELEYDNFGRLIKRLYVLEGGVSDITKYSYNTDCFYSPRASHKSFFESINGANEAPKIDAEGYHSVHYMLDYRGRVLHSEKKDLNGELVEDRYSYGEAYIQYIYDRFNRKTEESYYDTKRNKKRIQSFEIDHDYYKKNYQYDNRDNITYLAVKDYRKQDQKYFDTIIEEQFKKFDNQGQMVEEFKKKGDFVSNDDGTVIQKFKYDGDGNISVTYNFDDKSDPMKDNDGYYGYEYEYNNQNQVITKRYLSSQYKYDDPCDYCKEEIERKPDTKIHLEKYKYEKYERVQKSYFQDKMGKMPAEDEYGVSLYYMKRDPESNQTALRYFKDINDKYTNGPLNDIAREEFEYDIDGTKISEKYYSVNQDGKLILKFKGCQGSCDYIQKIEVQNSKKSIKYFREIDNVSYPHVNENGVHEIRFLYDDNNQPQSISFWGVKIKTNRENKRRVISTSKFFQKNSKSIAQINKLLDLNIEIDQYLLRPYHIVNIARVRENMYVSLRNSKSKDVAFLFNGKDKKYLILDSLGSLVGFTNDIPDTIDD